VPLSGDKATILAAVANLQQMKLNTATGLGFQAAQTMLAGGRKKTNGSLAILLTDGMANAGPDPLGISKSMKTAGIQIFGIGVGAQVDKAELQSWVSTPLSKYFYTSAQWADLEKIIDQILQNACPTPPPPSSPFRLGMPKAGGNCQFHLPANLPLTSSPPLELEPAYLEEVEHPLLMGRRLQAPPAPNSSNTSDPCNAFDSCSGCIGSRKGLATCGWCTGKITYANQSVSKYQCAGRELGIKDKWTCAGQYQTSTCGDDTACGLEGTYRGLRIDHKYDIGEWSATFAPAPLGATETASIEYLPPTGAKPKPLTGKMECTKKCNSGDVVPFKLTLASGDIMHGICGYADQDQAETSGLMFSLSNLGVASAPSGWDSAMNGTNATVYTLYKCADYKSSVCDFKLP